MKCVPFEEALPYMKAIAAHRETPEKEAIMEEVEQNLEAQYQAESITMQQKLQLIQVMRGHRR